MEGPLKRLGRVACAVVVLGGLVALASRSADGTQAAAASNVLPPLSWSGTVTGTHHHPVGATTTWTANLHFDLDPGPEDRDQWTYYATGSVTYQTSGSDGGCTYNGTNTFQLSGDDGVLDIIEGRNGWTYSSDVVARGREMIVHVTCPDASSDSEIYMPDVLRTSAFEYRPVASGSSTIAGTYSEGGGEANWTWSFSGTPRKTPGLTADPGGPYKVKRANRVTLDGSRSKPRAKITDYIWRLRPVPGDCEEVPTSTTARKEGRQTRVVALCGLRATLTVVARNGDRDSASTVVEVLPRGPSGWRTPFHHREKTGDPRTPRDPPSATSAGGGQYGFALFGGANVSDCGGGGKEILCPPAKGGGWLGGGYELAQVNDPKGPFDGFSYVASSALSVKRATLMNPSILPGSQFYQHNLAAGKDVAGFVAAIRQHEGLGNGTPRSGHSLIIKTILRSPTGDARRVIERLFAPSREGTLKKVNRALHVIDQRLDKESDDPLPDIWTGDIDFYDSYQQMWIHGVGFRIPGNMRD